MGPRLAAVVLAVVLSLAACTSGSDTDPAAGPTASRSATGSPSATTRPAAPMADPPPGMRWQGTNGVVVAVPEDWETSTDPSWGGSGPIVRFLSRAALAMGCLLRADRPDAALLVASNRAVGRFLAGDLSLRTGVGGVEVLSSRLRCRPRPIGPCFLTFAVPSRDATFQVTYRGPHPRRYVQGLRASVTRVPSGYTMVPIVRYGRSDATAVRLLEAAGLTAEVPDVDFPHYVTGTVPPAGTPVPAGAVVRLTVGDG